MIRQQPICGRDITMTYATGAFTQTSHFQVLPGCPSKNFATVNEY
jgi:hypothetical protein